MKSCGPAAGRREENRKTGIWVGKENPMDNDKTFEEMYSEITPKLIELSLMCERTDRIDPGLYEKYDVKPGLRDLNGKGVVAGLTEVSRVSAKKTVDGKEVPCEGHLYYRGRDVRDLVKGFSEEGRYGYEEAAHLLLFGDLPDRQELEAFRGILARYQQMFPQNFVREIIMTAPSNDMMNVLARSTLTLYSYDDAADDISLPNVLRQCLQLIAMMPMIAIYGYQTYQHYYRGNSLVIRQPEPGLSFSENILHMLRKDGTFTALEARILDICLVLHMEHGGGNNSTFTDRVVTSSGTDTYSVFAAALGSLKGPRHGGANIKVRRMMEDIKSHVRIWEDKEEVAAYLEKILDREAFDHSGLIYGIGHAVYSISDPRAEILEKFAGMLSEEKGLSQEMNLYHTVESLAPSIIAKRSHMYKGVSANVDFFSGFVYEMLGLPLELYTPLFAIARSVGWSAHRMEELARRGKIIRPAYIPVHDNIPYVPMDQR